MHLHRANFAYSPENRNPIEPTLWCINAYERNLGNYIRLPRKSPSILGTRVARVLYRVRELVIFAFVRCRFAQNAACCLCECFFECVYLMLLWCCGRKRLFCWRRPNQFAYFRLFVRDDCVLVLYVTSFFLLQYSYF